MKPFISIVLTFLLLLSSSGLTYAQHFCGEYEMLSKITLGEPHLSCGMMMVDSGCGDEHKEGHHCCDNQYTNVDTDDNFAGVSFDLQINPVFLASSVSIYILQTEKKYSGNFDCYKDYGPPPLDKDLQLLNETFLI